MTHPLRILLIEDNPDDRALMVRELHREFSDLTVEAVTEESGFVKVLEGHAFSLIVIDYSLGWTDGLAVLRALKARWPDCSVIMFTGACGEEIAVEAMKAGLDDFVLKVPQHYARLPAAVRSVLGRTEARRRATQAEAALRQANMVIGKSPAILFRMRAEKGWPVEFVSKNVTQFGYTAEELLDGKVSYASLLYPDDLDRVVHEAKEFCGQGTDRFQQVYRVVTKEGAVRWVDDRRVAERDPDGRITHFQGIVLDITERKQLEEQLRQAQKMEAVGRLAGGIAHDFNNLLTIITGYSELLLRRLGENDPLRRELEEIRKAGDRAAALTRQLLTFSRKQVLQPTVLDLNALVTNMDRMLQRLIGEDIELVTVLAPELGRVQADPGLLEQVIMNLAVNARDAMPKGGKLTVETVNVERGETYARRHVAVQPGPYVMLAVSDTGVGMDAETQTHIFEPFFTTKEEGKGTGLGLSTVYGIVKQSGGDIWAYSEPGQGATFKIYLPQVKEGAKPREQAAVVATPLTGTETVLLVEDEPALRRFVHDTLRQYGYTVLEAKHGIEALVIGTQHTGPIHLLITDVVMPQMSGREVAERLALLCPEMRVLYVSGYTDDAIIRHGMLDPGTVFLQKPFTPDALARKVREVLDG